MIASGDAAKATEMPDADTPALWYAVWPDFVM
jgi:hypothetical protein